MTEIVRTSSVGRRIHSLGSRTVKTIAELERALQTANIRADAYAMPGQLANNEAYGLERYAGKYTIYHVYRSEFSTLREFETEEEAVTAFFDMVTADPSCAGAR